MIEHPEWIPPEKLNEADLYAGSQKGRIYRVVSDSAKPSPRPKLHEASPAELVQQLSNPNMWWRNTAQRLLVERQDQSAVPALKEMARSGSLLGRAHSLWTLEGLGALEADLVLPALENENPKIREQAIRLAENHLQDERLRNKLLQMREDPDERVQFQLACTLGQLPKEQTFQTQLQVGLRHIDDQWFQLAVLSSIREDASRWYQVVTSQRPFVGNPSPGAGSFLAQLASILGARQKDREIADVLTAVSKSRSERDVWWQVASLEGLANGLKRGPASQVKLPAGQPLLLQLLATRSTLIQNATLRVMTQVDLVATPELRTAMAKASRVALSQDAKLEDRTQAIGILGLDPTASTLPSLEKFLSPQQPQEIQVAAVGALSNLRDPRVAALLLERWRTYTSPVRQAALAGLLSDRNRLLALLDSIKAEKVQPWSLTRTMRSQLLHSPDPEIGQKAKILLVDSSDNDRKAVFEKYKPALRLPGNPERGKQIFNEVCSKCHKIGSMGYEVGPDLLSVTGRPKGQLMTDILMPNLNLEDGYEEYLAQTTDGRLITGVISKQNPMAVTLRRAKGEEDTILRSNITNLRSLSLSPMPEDVEKGINLEGMADLLAFLKSL